MIIVIYILYLIIEILQDEDPNPQEPKSIVPIQYEFFDDILPGRIFLAYYMIIYSYFIFLI